MFRKFLNLKTLMAVAAIVVAVAGFQVYAQVTLPQVSTLNPTLDRVQVIPRGAPSSQSVYASPAQLGTTAYSVNIAVSNTTAASGSGYSNTFLDYQAELLLRSSAPLSYSYVTFSANPSDGARQCLFSVGAITALWLSANTGQSINNAATTLSSNSRVCYSYSLANATWNRSQ